MGARRTQGPYLVAEVLGDDKYKLAREDGEPVSKNIFYGGNLVPSQMQSVETPCETDVSVTKGPDGGLDILKST